ncbi:hypothetical protein H072_3168 [Dactylellina haptotyla CBS 200.50]|uniref:Uncharacterized protein n=1 Tax=Dactylellina haptotyla (strain CBS 200.50) TaxID=1284197 RepID=S8AP40_DACHA|nr:hypothetical protein H072_3168 [Dactylellina haptotyla CBS 200.50]
MSNTPRNLVLMDAAALCPPRGPRRFAHFGPANYLTASVAGAATPALWRSRRSIANKLSSLFPATAPDSQPAPVIKASLFAVARKRIRRKTPTVSSTRIFLAYVRRNMDELLVTAYPYIKSTSLHAKHIIAFVFQKVYPSLNWLYNTNPNIASIVLLLLAAYFTVRLVNWVTSIIWAITRNIFKFFFLIGLGMAVWRYFTARMAPRMTADGQVLEGFDWDATYSDFQGVWGVIRNMGGVLMDLIESGSNLEDGNAANSGRRKTMGKKAAQAAVNGWFD